jgi:hypothetical protein
VDLGFLRGKMFHFEQTAIVFPYLKKLERIIKEKSQIIAE